MDEPTHKTNGHEQIMYMLGQLHSKVDSVLVEAKKTNGRVTDLEKDMTGLKVSDGITKTKMGIIGAVAGAVGAFILNMFK